MLCLSGCVTGTEILPQQRPLWHSLEPGPYPVGYRLLHVEEAAAGKPGRVIRTALWYPIRPGASQPRMRFGDYLDVAPRPELDAALEDFMRSRDRDSLGRQFFGADAEAEQVALMAADIPVTADAQPARGPFPLVLHSLGRNGNQFQHSILWEYLASYGFAVASVAQLGASLDEPSMEFDATDLSFQLRDMQGTIDALSSFDFIDSRRIGLLGHSSGAIVSLWLAAADERVAAVVGLDGSNNRAENIAVLARGLGEKTVSAPFLNICRWPHAEFDDQFTSLLAGPIARVGFEKAIHFDFQNWPSYQAFAGAVEPRSMAVRSVADAQTVFETSAIATRLFLASHLQFDEASSLALADPNEIEKISRGLATLTITRQKGPL